MKKTLINAAGGIALIAIGTGAGFAVAPDSELPVPEFGTDVIETRLTKIDDDTYERVTVNIIRQFIRVEDMKSDIAGLESQIAAEEAKGRNTEGLRLMLKATKDDLVKAYEQGVANATSTP